VFPAASIAFAVYVCEPSATPRKALLQLPSEAALVVPLEVAPSKISTRLPASADPPSVKLPVALVLPSGGLSITGAAGASRSIVHERTAGVPSGFPAGSVARTANVWLPPARPVYVLGVAHAV
jgi:hypothetical protein